MTAIGSHGQTLRHRPDLPTPFTWQIGDPNTLAEMTGITVVADFRRRDVAAGGQGAPLLPVFHDQVFRSDAEDRVIANLGGIANITILQRGTTVTGFDTGPANRLLDAWMALHQGKDFDADGAWAGTGRCDDALLQQLLDEPYLSMSAAQEHRPRAVQPALARAQARPASSGGRRMCRRPCSNSRQSRSPTAVRQYAPGAALYVCGGGAHNAGLLQAIAQLMAPNRVATTAALGLDPDYVEAVAFAWFARRTLEGLTSSAASVTGAAGARILGGVYRYA